MIYKLRIILDTEKDVIREIAIHQNNSLEDLHTATADAFGFDGSEMASFYTTDNDWNQGEEIALFDMSELGDSVTMQHFKISDVIDNENTKLIYVYDFFLMWSFYIELVDIVENKDEYNLPSLLFSLGEIPEKAPEKEFKSEPADGGFDDQYRVDDFDFDNFDELIN